MRVEELDYHLPKELIAQSPVDRRDRAKLLVLDRRARTRAHRHFYEIVEYVRPGDVLVVNNSRVTPSVLMKGRTRALLLQDEDHGAVWTCMLDSEELEIRVGASFELAGRLKAQVVERIDQEKWRVEFDRDVRPLLEEHGKIALPLYIRRPEGPSPLDRERYQTVYAEKDGSVAAPTAGLHFTPDLLRRLADAGVEILKVTLHVGKPTSALIDTPQVGDFQMDCEHYEIPPAAAERLDAAHRDGRRVVAVGTTSCRTIETYARTGARAGRTNIFISPPFEFRRVGALVTNFHLPRGTPLALTCAFAGRDTILETYEEAVRRRYRFFSYGDAMLIL